MPMRTQHFVLKIFSSSALRFLKRFYTHVSLLLISRNVMHTAEMESLDQANDDTAHGGGARAATLEKASVKASVTGQGGTADFLHAVEEKRALKVLVPADSTVRDEH